MNKDDLFDDIGEIIGTSEEVFYDRTAREFWPLIVNFVADWMTALPGPTTGTFRQTIDEVIIPRWRKDMRI